MNGTTLTFKGDGNKIALLILQSLCGFCFFLLISTFTATFQKEDYHMSIEVVLLFALAYWFFRKKFLNSHGFENVTVENSIIKHRIYRWIFSSNTKIDRTLIKKIQLVNIRKIEGPKIPDYFSDYRIELTLPENKKYYIGNFISKKEAENLIKELR